ncbi:MAG: UDP-N-acetylmuramate--L-alanine ligase [Sedimentibacter sp.]|uniref:UDP-N-acetylmuramate--L-alanine ligase n=1 Tax=Sedimentibacter sp. TaxID=1960295 RepID=UPI00298299A2|nr:UDP-N-acetylmuramate--L-alanine ligase [Sedimentibacter sp.]MDW5298780.1 UDP-N-acetylmuramate--L-alanine ligase [Sedimentibacter sp.]
MNINFKHIYFIGIGGISMSALAEIMIDEGVKVSGSDRSSSHIIKKLESMGIKININHESKNITDDIDLVVYTSAISSDNPELLRAQELKLKIMDRAEFLGLIMKKYKNAICVSGTHGKTTTTGMLSSILIETNLKPTIFLGGEMDSLGGNLKHGSYDMLLTEACEYKRNFLKFNPTMELILNIDEDHLDYYKDLKDIENAFVEYGEKLPEYGHLIVNVKNEDLFKHLNCNVITFGMDDSAKYYPDNIKLLPSPSYTLMRGKEKITEISLKVFGEHNLLNSVAAAAACMSLGIESSIIKDGLFNFSGTHRRYEYKGTCNNATVIDDYAHHPSEMKATLKTAKTYTKGKIITVFQPHTFTRTIKLLDGFAKALSLSDEAILLDIYAAREKNTGEVHSKDIISKMKEYSKDAHYAENFQAAADIIKSLAHKGDIIITMGAGNVNEVAELIIEK